MPHPLLDRDAVDLAAEQYLRSVGTVFAEFGALTQDSGDVSYGVQIGAKRYFVKAAGRPDDPPAALNHAARVALLRNAVRLRKGCEHATLPSLYRVIESPTGPMLIYEWLDGELLRTPRAQRDDPTSAFRRFRSLPADTILGCLDAVYDLHEQIAGGWMDRGRLLRRMSDVRFRGGAPRGYRPRHVRARPVPQLDGAHVRLHAIHGTRRVRVGRADRRADQRLRDGANGAGVAVRRHARR